tara:strand:+ start:1154 stop:1357 length:204 start_codon:yes stop_codon:yes gene_type:complete
MGDVEYSRLSGALTFKVSLNQEAVQTVEDIAGSTTLTPKEIASEIVVLLQNAIQTNYHRGGMRRKYD